MQHMFAVKMDYLFSVNFHRNTFHFWIYAVKIYVRKRIY